MKGTGGGHTSSDQNRAGTSTAVREFQRAITMARRRHAQRY